MRTARWFFTCVCLGLFLTVSSPLAAAEEVDSVDSAGWIQLLGNGDDGGYTKFGWNHCGDGWFELDRKTGVLTTAGEGGGMLWYSARKFRDFVLELDFLCGSEKANSGVFLRVPEMPVSYDYIYDSFEIQIYESLSGGAIHTTGAIYDAQPPVPGASLGPGCWNHMRITCRGIHFTVELNGSTIVDWDAEPRGKVKSFWPEGYIGLQNHSGDAPVRFRNLRLKEL